MSALTASLAMKNETTDKVYHLQVEAYLAGFIVNFQFGKRGGTLQSGSKTKKEVSMEAATAIFESIIAEKKAKGYDLLATHAAAPKAAPISTHAPVAAASGGERADGLPMLLNAIDEKRFMVLMQSDEWIMQEKKDGHRRSVIRNGSQIASGNRRGLSVPLTAPVADAVLALKSRMPADFILDGELMGDVFWPFDILRYTGIDLRTQPLEKRMAILDGLLDTLSSPALGRIPTAYTTAEKVALYDKIMAARGEGVVFKKLGTKYVAGRPNFGGNAVKYKFLGSATCIVTKQNGEKSSVGLAVLDGAKWIEIGNVTIPPNHKIPTAGILVEVEYMNILRGGSLYQAVYKGIRDDKTVADQYESLRFKGEAVTAAPAPVAPLPIHIRPTVKEAQSEAGRKAAATRKANAPAKPAPAPVEPGTMNAAQKAWATRRAKAATAAAVAA